jgi:hypothetical protein
MCTLLLVRRKRDDYDVATGMSYGVHLGVGISPYEIQKHHGNQRGPEDYRLLSKAKHLERVQTSQPALIYLLQEQAPRLPHCWLKVSSSPRYPHYGGVEYRW